MGHGATVYHSGFRSKATPDPCPASALCADPTDTGSYYLGLCPNSVLSGCFQASEELLGITATDV